MPRRRRTSLQAEGDREAARIAATLGREVRATRRQRRLTQAQLGERVGLSRSRMGYIERGAGLGAPLLTWVRLGIALRRPFGASLSRDLEPQAPADAGHLEAQELLLELTRKTGRGGSFEMPTRPDNPLHSVDVPVRDDRERVLVLNEIWNRFEDVGKAARSTDRKLAEAARIAVALGGADPYRVAHCWLLVDTAANRALVARFPEILAARFPGSSVAWVRALTHGDPIPHEPGIAWIDLRTRRLVPMRLRRSRHRPAR